MWDLMCDCWKLSPSERPAFRDIFSRLHKIGDKLPPEEKAVFRRISSAEDLPPDVSTLYSRTPKDNSSSNYYN
jgi:hypothetical protein